MPIDWTRFQNKEGTEKIKKDRWFIVSLVVYVVVFGIFLFIIVETSSPENFVRDAFVIFMLFVIYSYAIVQHIELGE